MDNKDIVRTIRTLVSFMELHDENEFKIRGYNNALFNLERVDRQLGELELAEIEQISGVGKSIAGTVHSIGKTGESEVLEALRIKTPEGVQELMALKGIGVKKVKTLWQEVGIESPKQLETAIDEGKLSNIKGFGTKTLENIKKILAFSRSVEGILLFADAEIIANKIIESLQAKISDSLVAQNGALRRRLEIIDNIQVLVGCEKRVALWDAMNLVEGLTYQELNSGPFTWRGSHDETQAKIEISWCRPKELAKNHFIGTGSQAHLAIRPTDGEKLREIASSRNWSSEKEIYDSVNLQFIEPELRESQFELQLAKDNKLPILIETNDLKGILHNHSTYSDGEHTLEQMASHCKRQGYEYLGIADHSKAAFYYANGMFENRVQEQHKEIDELNNKLGPFKIFKGIESDILPNGDLDYDPEILSTFDFVVASVHSGLTMDLPKAMDRLLKAINNPYTTIMGHLTGRVLLVRPGFPVDHKVIIDECAKNGVVIEINAHPSRLDIDWRWVHYALDQGVMLSINPDAHSKAGYDNMYYGVQVGRKGGLTKEQNLNSLSLTQIDKYFTDRKAKATAAIS